MPNLPKHHFVPWTYLRQFAIDPKAYRKESKIYMWDKKASFGGIEKTDKVKCYVKGQNTVSELPDPEIFEKRFAKIDAALGETIKMLLKTVRQTSPGFAFNSKNKDILANHLMLLFMRQPTMHDDILKKTQANIEMVKDSMREEYKDRMTIQDIDRVLASKSEKQYALEFSMDPQENEIKALQDKVWIYIFNKTNIPFITSDYPLCPQFISDYNGNGIADPGCILYFPVAPDVLIYMIDSIHFRSGEKKYFDNAIEHKEDQDFIQMANYLQHHFCTRQIYSNQQITPDIYSHPDDL